jgi:hypothetical protein
MVLRCLFLAKGKAKKYASRELPTIAGVRGTDQPPSEGLAELAKAPIGGGRGITICCTAELCSKLPCRTASVLRINGQIMSAAPNGELVLRAILSRVWKFKWLIAAATIGAALVTFVLFRSDAPQVWTGKTILTIGMAPTKSYLIQEDGPGYAPIKTQRDVIAEISDVLFKKKIIAQTALRPATAAFSREMAASSLRAVALNNDRDVAVEVSAASDEDVQAVLRGLAAEIEKEHKEIIKQRLDSVSAEVEDLQGRIAVIEKSLESIGRATDSVAEDKSQWRPSIVMPDFRTWSDLKDRIRRDSNLIKFSEPTVFRAEPDFYPRAARSIGALRASILAGLGMLAAMIVLTIVLSSRPRASDQHRFNQT